MGRSSPRTPSTTIVHALILLSVLTTSASLRPQAALRAAPGLWGSAHKTAIRLPVLRAAPAPEMEDAKKGIKWLPPLNPSVKEAESSGEVDTLVLPVFPLGSMAYVPGSKQVLNIFEPRYRQMYDDILLNGSRRFIVTMVNNEQAGQLAEVGVVFYLSELREVSEQTGDQIKFVCTHDVISRVRIHGIVNPRAGVDRSTYMKAECSYIEDVDDNADLQESQKRVLKKIEDIVNLQGDLEEEVRFERRVISNYNGGRSGEGGLWALVELWQAYLSMRVAHKSQRMQKELEAKIRKFLKESGASSKAISQNNFLAYMEPADRKDIQSMQERLREETAPMLDEQTVWVQLMLQTDEHGERLRIFESMVDREYRRLETRLALKRMFGEQNDGS